MKRGLKLGIFGLAIVLSAYFIFAASWPLAPSTASAGSTISMIAFNVSSNSHANSSNVTNFTSILVNITGTAYSGVRNVTNISLTNGTSTYYNDSFTTSPVNITLNVNVSNVSSSGNYTIKFTLNSSAKYNLTVGANVTAIGNRSYNELGVVTLNFSALPYNSSLVTITETTNPVATATCSPSTIYEGEAFPCSCSGTDSATTDSGVATSSGTSNSPDGTSIPTTSGTFTYTCSVTDNGGNSGSNTATYTVLHVGGGSSTPQPPKESYVWAKITPGAAVIMKEFDAEIGVNQITITVNNEAQQVKITVTKYDGKPAEVSISKSGKVYQYLQIDAQNLAGKLASANAQFRVEKSWVSMNSVAKEKISVYKFDGISKWNEQETTLSSEDSQYYYYDVSLDSFSYFVISERSLAAGEGTTTTGEAPAEDGGNKTWLWVLIILVVVIAVWQFTKKKKK